MKPTPTAVHNKWNGLSVPDGSLPAAVNGWFEPVEVLTSSTEYITELLRHFQPHLRRKRSPTHTACLISFLLLVLRNISCYILTSDIFQLVCLENIKLLKIDKSPAFVHT